MKRVVLAGLFFACLFGISRAEAYDTGCLRPPLPTTPTPPLRWVRRLRHEHQEPGPEITAEIRGGVRFPDGDILSLVNQTTSLSTGSSVLPLVPTQTLPGGLPTIDLLVEAAILEPTLGVTLSRHNVRLQLQP